MEFKDRLKALREEKGIKQCDVAEELDYVTSAISNYESGRNEPCISNLKKIARYFDVSMDYLLCVNDIRNPYITPKPGEVDEVFLSRYRKLSEEGRYLLDVFMKWLSTEYAEKGDKE